MRFKCVSKSWCSFINGLTNDPEFLAKHLHNTNKLVSSRTCNLFHLSNFSFSRNTSSFLATCNDPGDGEKEPIRVDTRFFDLPIFPGEKEFRYSEYYNCNGIICLAGFGEDMMLCNPVLREYLAIVFQG